MVEDAQRVADASASEHNEGEAGHGDVLVAKELEGKGEGRRGVREGATRHSRQEREAKEETEQDALTLVRVRLWYSLRQIY